jgi:hypothetical protein
MHEHKGIAEGLAAFGRGGDSMLMHVNPAEVEALNSMAPGSITINPDTGMPEAFFWLIPTLLQTVLGGIGTAATTGLGTVGLGALSPAVTGTLGTLGGTSGLAGVMGSAGAALGAPAGVTAKLGSMAAAGSLGSGAPAGAIAAPAAAKATVPGFTAGGGIAGPSAITQSLPSFVPSAASAAPSAGPAIGAGSGIGSGIGSGSGLSAIKAATTPSSFGLGSPAAAKGGMAAIKAATAPISQSLAPVKGGLSSIKAATTPAALGPQQAGVAQAGKAAANSLTKFVGGQGDLLGKGIGQGLRGAGQTAVPNVPSAGIRPESFMSQTRNFATGGGGYGPPGGYSTASLADAPMFASDKAMANLAAKSAAQKAVASQSFPSMVGNSALRGAEGLAGAVANAPGFVAANPIPSFGAAYMVDKWAQDPAEPPAWARRGKGRNNVWDPDYEFQVLRDPVWGPEVAGGWLPHGPDDPFAMSMGHFGGYSDPYRNYGG